MRSTDYQHLRDAFLRSLRGRIQVERKNGTLIPEDEDVSLMTSWKSQYSFVCYPKALEEPLIAFRSVFPNAPLAKGTSFVIFSQPPERNNVRSLVLAEIGQVTNTWIATQLFKAYFAGVGNSPAVKCFQH